MKNAAPRRWAGAIAAACLLTACNGAGTSMPQIGSSGSNGHSQSSPIQHVIVVVQENRTFNNLFATFPGTTGTTTGEERVGKGKSAQTKPIPLTEVHLYDKKNINHLYSAYWTAYRSGHMDAFNLIKYQATGKPEGSAPYQYVYQSDVQPYWTLAQTYAIADQMFQTQGSGSFTAHQDLIRGGTEINSTQSLVDDPTSSGAWGCTSPPGTLTSLITTKLKVLRAQGPYPCTDKFPSSAGYETLQVLLDKAGVSWKYYTPAATKDTVGALWNAFLVIDSVYGDQSEWNAHISTPETNIFTDISSNALPAVSWVIPDGGNSDHPADGSDTGPSWVTSVVNAVGASSYWNSTAIVVVWDDWGGFDDPVSPPKLDKQGGPGFRVGMLVISPYVPQGEISHTVYEFGSILRYIEDNWNLGRLGTSDGTATSIANMF
ncbi:MAG: alkaline phosphatase family protein, partial [Candidatus Baltobacteraceae bacterium]